MDSNTVIVGIKLLSKALRIGFLTRDAWTSEGIDAKELAALSALLELSGELGRKADTSDMPALHMFLITRCFGLALRRQGESTDSRDSRSGLFQWFKSKEEKQRDQEIGRRLESVLNVLRRPGDLPADQQEWDLVESLKGHPLATRYYRALWKEFSAAPSEDATVSALLGSDQGGRLRFERYFLLGYEQSLASPLGQPLERYLARLADNYRPRVLRELLLHDQATWGERHLFGNIERHEHQEDGSVPFMPLDEMYIEPDAAEHGRKEVIPVLGQIERLLRESRQNVFVVTADFGMGKSLTARKLAQRWSWEYLEGSRPSPELWLPVFIRCADDLKDEELDLEQITRHAWMRQASALDKKLKLSDPALSPPDTQQRTVFLLDGLDEVALDEKRMERLFGRIEEAATRQHRFIIFSRPGALPSEDVLGAIPVLELQAWREDQVEHWLTRWSKSRGEAAPTLQQIKDRGVGELASTPILLFMVVQTWKTHTEPQQVSRASLYEEFFQNIARGKHNADHKAHGVVHEASKKLHTQLKKQGLIDETSRVPEAMLWLMGRVAWEVTQRDQSRKFDLGNNSNPLTEDDIEALLGQELEIQGDWAARPLEMIKDGLLLAMQVHLQRRGASQFLFGHKSFREFLVARYWVARLKALARGTEQRRQLEAPLLGGRLLSREDRTFEFLMEILNADPPGHGVALGLTKEERSGVLQWACKCFESEEGALGAPSLRRDGQPLLREAALAIASRLRDSPGARVQDELTLRSLFAWFWLKRIGPIVIAPKAYLRGSILAELNLRGANFQEADLSGADFSNASMRSRRDDLTDPCDFSGAKLSKALLVNADLQHTLFVNANLEGARLEYANLKGARFEGANLEGANLKGALYNRLTRWPEGFDPESAGARRAEDDT